MCKLLFSGIAGVVIRLKNTGELRDYKLKKIKLV